MDRDRSRWGDASNLQTAVDGNGHTTTTVFDVMDRETNTITALGFRTTVVYNAARLAISSTEGVGDTTSITYDSSSRGLVAQVVQAHGTSVQASTLNTYDAAGLLSSSRNGVGWPTTYSYNPVGRLQQSINALGGVRMEQSDLAGQMIGSRDEPGRWTKQTYNLRGWVTQVTDALGNVTTSTFDASGNPLTLTDPLSQQTQVSYDKLDRVSKVTDALNRARNKPGLCVAGAFDGFGLAVRAILGQQVSVRAATTPARRFAEAFGQPTGSLFPALARFSPLPARVAEARLEELTGIGQMANRGEHGCEFHVQGDRLTGGQAQARREQ